MNAFSDEQFRSVAQAYRGFYPTRSYRVDWANVLVYTLAALFSISFWSVVVYVCYRIIAG